MVMLLADRLTSSSGAGEGRMARRRHRHPDVLADLDMEGDGTLPVERNSRSVPNGDGLARELDLVAR